MEYDSESSLEDKHKKRTSDQLNRQQQHQRSWRLVNAATGTSNTSVSKSYPPKISLGATANRSLSSQVMEYYQKYSQNANLSQYFALPNTTNKTAENAKYYYNIYDLSPKYIPDQQNSTTLEEYNSFKSYIPKERRRWARPPLIGQSSSTNGSTVYVKPMTEPQLSDSSRNSHKDQSFQQHSNPSNEGLIITEEKSTETIHQDISSPITITEVVATDRKTSSPTSSVTSHKPLEWDSGADVGYLYASGQRLNVSGSGCKIQQLSTLERMALARGCSAALRLDPEGTTEQQQSPGSIRTTVTAAVLSLTTRTGGNGLSKGSTNKPDANSTPLVGNVSESESEIEITPIVKNHILGIVTGNNIESEEISSSKCRKELLKDVRDTVETPKSSNIFKLPHALKYDDSKIKPKAPTPPPAIASTSKETNNSNDTEGSLKKSSSMNLLASSSAKFPLKRSQSELNLCGNEKSIPRLIFNSTSSIATVVNNKPITCNKEIQTSVRTCAQESIGVQVSVLKEEEKPPLPKRATSLMPRSLNSILKNSKSTYKVQNSKASTSRDGSSKKEEKQRERGGGEESVEEIEKMSEKEEASTTDSSHNASLTPHADDTENVTGRANSFEYFPGHIYENVPNGSSSHVSSVDTGRSNSTMPNTSSSIDEKLWGESDSLVRDLERSVNILKSLVDANKLDKQVKKRLIHHVVKRLVTAKYTDDKIERNLEENVPWNPADARNKVYRTEIIQALAKNTTDSSDDWKPAQKKKSPKKSAPTTESRTIKEMINIPAEIESSNSDKFDRNTDRTVMDGRKARMGLRVDDCDRRSSTNTPTNKSESSECFLPQRSGFNKNGKIKDMFVTSTTNSSPQDQNRALLDAVVNSRRTPDDSSNEAGNSADWRLPATASERRYEMHRCSNSDSGDSKLVSYAEMEKRNQLIWITNEISHLSNLKKLLEQSKTKSERYSKSPSRKTKQSSSKPQKCLPSTQRQQNGEISIEDSQLSRQWSSHCNLANCSSISVNSVTKLKKRNSCTQTATESSTAYSRTGSEIVSARLQNPNIKLVTICVQTSKPPSSPDTISPTAQLYSGCPIHQSIQPLTCTCTQHLCLHCESKNLIQHHPHINEQERIKIGTKCLSNDLEDPKETKNQLNATKLKCTCSTNVKTNDEQKTEKLKISESSSQTCDHCHYEDSMCTCRRFKIHKTLCQCTKDCECANKKLVCNLEKLQITDKASSRKNLFEKASTSNCNCECKKSGAIPNVQPDCTYHSTKKTKSHYLAHSSKEEHIRSCINCANKAKEQDSPKLSARTNNSTSSDWKCCQVCGKVYRKDRICNCTSKCFPKAVAYELSFVDDEKHMDDSESGSCSKPITPEYEIKCIDKQKRKSKTREKINRGSGCACGGLQRAINRCECNHRSEQQRKFNEKKNTLQDYLVSNNPGFADNVEIRRQYVSEIQRLRQLRKDRRVQLLAMATTTNVFASPTPNKVTKCVQKKISEEELKSRLRKRYAQLSEVRAKRKQKQLQEEARCNKLMAKIFCKKLQQKVLKGQVDLSQSVSVISNL